MVSEISQIPAISIERERWLFCFIQFPWGCENYLDQAKWQICTYKSYLRRNFICSTRNTRTTFMLRIVVTLVIYDTICFWSPVCQRWSHHIHLSCDVVSRCGMKQRIKVWVSNLIMSYLLPVYTFTSNLIWLIYSQLTDTQVWKSEKLWDLRSSVGRTCNE